VRSSRIKSLRSFRIQDPVELGEQKKSCPAASRPTRNQVLSEACSTRSQCPSTLDSILEVGSPHDLIIYSDEPHRRHDKSPVHPRALAHSPVVHLLLGINRHHHQQQQRPNTRGPYDIGVHWLAAKNQSAPPAPAHKWSSGQKAEDRPVAVEEADSHLRLARTTPATQMLLCARRQRSLCLSRPASRHTDKRNSISQQKPSPFLILIQSSYYYYINEQMYTHNTSAAAAAATGWQWRSSSSNRS
jgi:hypothetical protein